VSARDGGRAGAWRGASWWRSAALLAVALFGCRYYLRAVERVYPVGKWLFWTVAPLWGWSLVLNLAWAAFGSVLLRRALRVRGLLPLERLVLAGALGSVGFVLALYGFGALGLLRPRVALWLPLACVGLGAYDLAADLRALARRGEGEGGAAGRWVGGLAAAGGSVCVALVYLGLLTPDAINFDAAWAHLTIAQDYAREGRIVPFLGDYAKNHPQLASLVHTWGWLVPGLNDQQRWMLALHNEFSCFLWSLAATGAAAEWMLEGARRRGLWASFFLFPAIFVYDSNIAGTADHVLAFYAGPLFLTGARAAASTHPGAWALFGVLAGATMLTKYQAVYLIAAVSASVGLAYALKLGREYVEGRAAGGGPPGAAGARRALAGPLAAAAAGLLVASPHAIRNYAFFNNPFYPFAQDVFRGSWPALADSPLLVEYVFKDYAWRPHGTSLAKNVRDALELTWKFSFEPHYSFAKNFPNFGSLFTLCMPAALLVRRPARLLFGLLAGWLCVFTWAMTFRVDRNLQAFVPILAAATAAALVRMAREGRAAALGAAALVGVQLVWGGDALFYSAHDRIRSAMDLIRSGYEGRARDRLSGYRREYLAIRDAVPRGEKLLLHDWSLYLGIDREVVRDHPGHQGYLDYRHLRGARGVYDHLKSLGINWVLTTSPGGQPDYSIKQGEVLFFDMYNQACKAPKQFGGLVLCRLERPPPPDPPDYRVLTLGLHGYADGLYDVAALNVVEDLPEHVRPPYPKPARPLAAGDQQTDGLAMAREANAFITSPGRSLSGELGAYVKDNFQPPLTFRGSSMYLRKASTP
jgi:hypothetical protein